MYFYREGADAVGPFTPEKLQELFRKGVILPGTLIKAEGTGGWFEYEEFCESWNLESYEAALTQWRSKAEPRPDVSVEEDKDHSSVNGDDGWVITPVAPWRRYFARAFDLTLFGVLGWFALGLAWYSIAPMQADRFFIGLNPAVDLVLTAVIGTFISGFILAFFGSTPGKAVFGIRVRNKEGSKLSVSEGLTRDLDVLVRGLGLAIPLVSVITLIVAYSKLKRNGVTSWDSGTFHVSYKQNSGRQIALNIFGVILYLILFVLVSAIGSI